MHVEEPAEVHLAHGFADKAIVVVLAAALTVLARVHDLLAQGADGGVQSRQREEQAALPDHGGSADGP